MRSHCRGSTARERSRDARARKAVSTWKLQSRTRTRVNQNAWKEISGSRKITDVPYINGYVGNQVKPVNEDSLSLRSAGLTRAAST